MIRDERTFEPPRDEALLLLIARATAIEQFKLTRYINTKCRKYCRWTSESRMEASREAMITGSRLSWRRRRGEHASIRRTRTGHLRNGWTRVRKVAQKFPTFTTALLMINQAIYERLT